MAQARFWVVVLLAFVLTSWGLQNAHAQTTPELPTEAPRWDGRSRYTVLILGMDRRPNARDNLNARTDVIILASYDPATRSIGLLHFPRDLFMPTPDTGQPVRVNTLMVLGERQLEGYGPFYAMQTLQYNLGMYVDGYVAFDFVAFIQVIDAMGGITLDVPYTINDPLYPDMNYGYDPFFLRGGVQVLDGRTALKYTRTRHGDNDYVRGQRQLQVVQGVRERLAEPATLQALLGKAPQLLGSLQGHVYSNIPPEQLVFLGLVMMEQNASITTGAINQSNTFEYNLAGEGTVRVPDRNKLVEELVRTFGAEYWR